MKWLDTAFDILCLIFFVGHMVSAVRYQVKRNYQVATYNVVWALIFLVLTR